MGVTCSGWCFKRHLEKQPEGTEGKAGMLHVGVRAGESLQEACAGRGGSANTHDSESVR